MKKKPCTILLIIVLLFFPCISFAEPDYDILKLIGPRYEKIQKSNINLEWSTGYFYKSEEIEQRLVNPALNRAATDLVTSRVFMSYGITDSISCHLGAPFIYIQDDNSTQSEKHASGLGDLSAGVTLQKFSDTGALMLDLTYYNPTGKSPYKIDLYDELPTGNGVHSINPEIAFFKFLGPVVLYGIGDIEYSLPVNDLSQRRYDPNTYSNVLTKVEPGIVLGLNLGTAVDFSKTFSANWGLAFRQYEKSKYKWQGGYRTTEQSTTAYFYAGATMTLNNYTFFPEVTIGTTDDSYDFGFSIRLPLL